MFQVLCFLTMIIHGSKNVNYKTTVELVDHAFLSMITIGWHLQIITGKSIDPILGTNWSNHVPIIIWILGSLQRIHVKLLLPKIGINLITSTLLIDRHDLWTRGQVPQCQLIMKINTNPLKVKTILNFSWHYGMAGMHTNDPPVSLQFSQPRDVPRAISRRQTPTAQVLPRQHQRRLNEYWRNHHPHDQCP